MIRNANHRVGFRIMLVAGVVGLLLTISAQAKDIEKFERIKSLVGKWEGTSTSQHEGETKAVFEFTLTAGGSAVIERQFVGTDHEMITMYYMSREDLLLTHYCMLGNQPRMVATDSGGKDEVSFGFVDKTGNVTEGDAHMHNATITFVGPDHIRAQWTLYKEGQKADVAKIDLKRVQ